MGFTKKKKKKGYWVNSWVAQWVNQSEPINYFIKIISPKSVYISFDRVNKIYLN